MHPHRPSLVASVLAVALATAPLASAQTDWPRFRGPNGSGVAQSSRLPVQFGPAENVVWKTSLPPGHSSPVLTENRIFLTAHEEDKLITICLDRATGEVLWRRRAPRDRDEKRDPRNGPASPTPAVDAEHVGVFFPDFGLLCYDHGGNLQWQRPLGPFNNIYGMGASPILVGDLLVLVCDQSTGSFAIALDKHDGSIVWKVDRPEAKSGHSTPILYQPPEGGTELLVPGSFQLTAYATATGQKRWWVRGLSFEMKSTPVMDEQSVYVNGYGSPWNQPGKQVSIPEFETMLQASDADGNGFLARDELPEKRDKAFFGFIDLDGNRQLSAAEWNYYRAAMASKNGMLAIRLGGEGDMTDSHIRWQEHRSVPQLPSPLLYKGILYMIDDGGIATSLDPATGQVIHRGRLAGAVDDFYASPVAADDKIFCASRSGKVVVVKPDGSLGVLALNDLAEPCYATPAIGSGRIYLRTAGTLYAFGLTGERERGR